VSIEGRHNTAVGGNEGPVAPWLSFRLLRCALAVGERHHLACCGGARVDGPVSPGLLFESTEMVGGPLVGGCHGSQSAIGTVSNYIWRD